MTVMQYLMLAAALPGLAFFILIFWGRRVGNGGRFAGALATTLAFGAFALSVAALIAFVSRWADKPGAAAGPAYMEAVTYRWIVLPMTDGSVDRLNAAGVGVGGGRSGGGGVTPGITVGLLADSLTVAAFLLVTFLGMVVHFFSLGYAALQGGSEPEAGISDDRRRGPQFFALVNLMIFGMLGLLLANSLVQFFIFWQLVGIAAYLLVSLERERRGRGTVAFRLFTYSRISDAAFLVGIGLLLAHLGGSGIGGLSFFDAQGVSILGETVGGTLGVRSSEFLYFTGQEGGGLAGLHWLTWAGICFIIAALVRAAQFPFMPWLEDAAEGAAPMAALVQTCTMVASGAVLLARIYPILTMDARLVLAVVGCVSLMLAALVACAQTDVRKILAWSTASQMGYVFLFLGAGGYMPGLLHLFTHAFFKAGLILAGGLVIQAMQGETDLRQMGGLWKRMPITAAASLVMVLALAGTPWLSGAYSENIGLARVYDYAAALRGAVPVAPVNWRVAKEPEMLLLWLPLLATYVTAFGIGRWWWLIFVSPMRNEKLQESAHESPLGTTSLIILAGFSVGMWFDFFGILQFINRSLAAGTPVTPSPADTRGDTAFGAVAPLTGLAVGGVIVAFLMYVTGFGLADRLRKVRGLNVISYYLRERLFLGTMYQGLVGNGVDLLARGVMIIDRFVLGAGFRIVAFAGEALAHLVLQLDGGIDRPFKRLAWAIAPRLRRILPAPPVDERLRDE